MQFLVLFLNKPEFVGEGGKMPDDFLQRLAEDTLELRKMYEEGAMRQIWTLDIPERGGAALVEAASTEEAEQLMQRVPLVALDYNNYELYPLMPYRGFGPR